MKILKRLSRPCKGVGFSSTWNTWLHNECYMNICRTQLISDQSNSDLIKDVNLLISGWDYASAR